MRKTLVALLLSLFSIAGAEKPKPYVVGMPGVRIELPTGSIVVPYPTIRPGAEDLAVPEPPLPRRTNILDGKGSCETLDIMLLVDTTGSMEPHIEDIKARSGEFLDLVTRTYTNTRFAVARVEDHPLGFYGYPGNEPYKLLQEFTDDRNAVRAAIGELRSLNGGDPAEAYDYALRMASNEPGWRNDARRFIVLVADDYVRDEGRLDDVIRKNNATV